MALLGAVGISSASQMLLKRGAQGQHRNFWEEYWNPWVIGGYALMVLSTLFVIYAYRGVDYKNGPVVESLGFVLVMLLGRLFFHEPLTRKKVLGLGIILCGIAVFYLA